MNKKNQAIYIVAFATAAFILAFFYACRQNEVIGAQMLPASSKGAANEVQISLSFPFEVMEEKRVSLGTAYGWEVVIVLSKQYYSKENLEALFHVYSNKFSDKKDEIFLEVYSSKENYVREVNKRSLDPGDERLLKNYYDAVFHRERDSMSEAGFSEWYEYRPNTDDSNVMDTVVLNGRNPNDPNVDLSILHITPQVRMSERQSTTGFAYDVLEEKPWVNNLKIIKILLPKERYSKLNLEALFSAYSSKYSNNLDIYIYTDLNNYKREKVMNSIYGGVTLTSGTEGKRASKIIHYDAVFHRDGNNEWYTYTTKLGNPKKLETIVIKGKVPYETN